MAWPGRRRSAGREGQVAMMILLLVPLCTLALTTPAAPQQLDFWVLETSVSTEQRKAPANREPYFLLHRSPRMVCKYASHDYCALRANTRLTVYPNDTSQDQALIGRSLVVLERTKCNLTVELQNVTLAFEGRYRCQDLLNDSQFRTRHIHVGEAPVAPQNVRVVVQPASHIEILLDPVRTGQDLNDAGTKWSFTYTWKNRRVLRSCSPDSDVHCRQLTAEGLCRACVIPLSYRGCGMYTQGSVDLKLRFNWTVHNSFGSFVKKPPRRIYISKWLRPGPGLKIAVKEGDTSGSQLALRVSAPNVTGMDQAHKNFMDEPLELKYQVALLPARDQSLLSPAGASFNRTYGFVRNLRHDEHALKECVRQLNFSGLSDVWEWSSSAETCGSLDPASVVMGGLPFAGTRYNLSLTAKARYWGPSAFLIAKTDDTAPLEGPRLDDNFVFCLSNGTNPCTTCVLYFNETPQCRRGGDITQHTLHMTLIGDLTDPRSDSCQNGNGTTLTVGGADNTFLVRGLAVGAAYEVRIQAVNSAGSANSSAKTLNVTAEPGGSSPRDVVLERAEAEYTASWTPGGAQNVTHHAHLCYAAPLHITQASNNRSMDAPQPLKCVTNLERRTQSAGQTSVVFSPVPSHPGLTPAFFVSATGPQGRTTGLLHRVDCFYAKGKFPSPVDPRTISAQPEADHPGSLTIRFLLPCGGDLSYPHGRPGHYTVRVLASPDHCTQRCGQLMAATDQQPSQPTAGRLKGQVVFTQRGLRPHTRYCVGINVAGTHTPFHSNSWSCAVATTGRVASSFPVWGIAVISVCLLLPLFLIIIYKCWKHHKKTQAKFTRNLDFKGIGTENPTFKAEGSPEAHTVAMPGDLEGETDDATRPGERPEVAAGGWKKVEEDGGSEGTGTDVDDGEEEETQSASDTEDKDPTRPHHLSSSSPALTPADRYPTLPSAVHPPPTGPQGGASEGSKDEGSVSGSATDESQVSEEEDEEEDSRGECERTNHGVAVLAPHLPQHTHNPSPLIGSGRGVEVRDPDTTLDVNRILESAGKAAPDLTLTWQRPGDSGAQMETRSPALWPSLAQPASGLTPLASPPPCLAQPASGLTPLASPPPRLPLPSPPQAEPRPASADAGSPITEEREPPPRPTSGSARREGEEDGGVSSADVDIESVLHSLQKNSSVGDFELSPSGVLDDRRGALDDRRGALDDRRGALDAAGGEGRAAVGGGGAQTELPAVGGLASGPSMPTPTPSAVSAVSQGDASGSWAPQAEGSEPGPASSGGESSDPYTPLSMKLIEKAVEHCPWGGDFELSPYVPPTPSPPLQPQLSVSDGEWTPASSKESGFSTDGELTSSTESGLEKVPPRPLSKHPGHGDAPSGPSPSDRDPGLTITPPWEVQHSLLGRAHSQGGEEEEEEASSPSHYPLLPSFPLPLSNTAESTRSSAGQHKVFSRTAQGLQPDSTRSSAGQHKVFSRTAQGLQPDSTRSSAGQHKVFSRTAQGLQPDSTRSSAGQHKVFSRTAQGLQPDSTRSSAGQHKVFSRTAQGLQPDSTRSSAGQHKVFSRTAQGL
ncbi:hypothetical protein ACOMHN_004320 [Nucella lapillus]